MNFVQEEIASLPGYLSALVHTQLQIIKNSYNALTSYFENLNYER